MQLAKPQLSPVIIRGLVLTFVVMLVALLASYVLTLLGLQGLPYSLKFIITRIIYWLCLGVIYLYVTRQEKQPILLWTEQNYGAGFYFASVFGIIGCYIFGSAMVALIINLFYSLKGSEKMAIIMAFSLPLKFFIAFTAGIVEEFIFRGYLLPRLQLFFKSKHWPIVIGAILFGLAHFRYGTIMNVIGPIILGIIAGYHYQKYRNIRALILAHFLYDFMALAANFPHK